MRYANGLKKRALNNGHARRLMPQRWGAHAARSFRGHRLCGVGKHPNTMDEHRPARWGGAVACHGHEVSVCIAISLHLRLVFAKKQKIRIDARPRGWE